MRCPLSIFHENRANRACGEICARRMRRIPIPCERTRSSLKLWGQTCFGLDFLRITECLALEMRSYGRQSPKYSIMTGYATAMPDQATDPICCYVFDILSSAESNDAEGEFTG